MSLDQDSERPRTSRNLPNATGPRASTGLMSRYLYVNNLAVPSYRPPRAAVNPTTIKTLVTTASRQIDLTAAGDGIWTARIQSNGSLPQNLNKPRSRVRSVWAAHLWATLKLDLPTSVAPTCGDMPSWIGGPGW